MLPVPLYPPFRPDRIAEYATRQTAILENAGVRLLVTFREVERLASLLRRRVATLDAVVAADAVGDEARPPRPGSADDSALIQYTSGSTGHPKGVLLSHGNLLANVRAIQQRLEVGPNDVAVSWLPLYHDMGLIGAWLGALYFGVPWLSCRPSPSSRVRSAGSGHSTRTAERSRRPQLRVRPLHDADPRTASSTDWT